MFKSVTVKNFRAITDLRVDGLSRVNLFVGHNACGKTTFLEGVFFLIGATNPKLPVNVNTFRGFPYVSKEVWPTYFHNMNTNTPIEISGGDSESGEEMMLSIGPRYERSKANTEGTRSVLSVAVAPTDSESEEGVNGLTLEYCTSADPGARHVSQVFVRDGHVVEEGTKERPARGVFVLPVPVDLTARFSAVQRKKRVSEVVALLAEIEPTLEDLRLLDPPGVLYADTGISELIPVTLMGGGIGKLLSVALAMLDAQNGFVLIDEVENGLGYASQQRLWDTIFSWAEKLNVQVFASTHSRECIRAFSDCAERELFGAEAKLFRIERKNEDFRAVEYTRELLAESLQSEWEVR